MGYVGTYDRTIFYNPSNKYCIISVKTSDQSVPQQARSAYRHRDNMIRFIAVGYELPQTDKVSMILDGEWENGKHGVQLQVDKCEEIVPQTKEGVYGYLSSRLIKGVGEKTAALIVNRFGADALRVLENEPERLLEIRGITPDKLEDIKASYAESRCVRDLMILLTPFNVTPVTAMKIYEHFALNGPEISYKKVGINWKDLTDKMDTSKAVKELGVPEKTRELATLSGGNIQRCMLARAVMKQPKILLASYPSRGLDVGTVEMVHQTLVELRNQGCSILLVSEDLEELLSVSDSIVVISGDTLTEKLDPKTTSALEIGDLMIGGKEHER